MEPLRAGLMGLGRGGLRLAEVLQSSSWCKLVAVAGAHADRTDQFAERHPGITTLNDFRSLIVSSGLDVLFVAVPPYLRENYLPLAAERKLPVWMLTPPARQFDETIALLEKFEAGDTPIVVARDWGIEPGLNGQDLQLDQAGRFFLARSEVMLCLEENLNWRGDSQRAGGGVLLYRAYSSIDVIVQVMGLPSSVFAAVAGVSRPGSRFPYDTEDTASVLLQYANGAIATITACWTAGPDQWSLQIHGTERTFCLDHHTMVLRDRCGTQELLREERPARLLDIQVEDFLSRLSSGSLRETATLRHHLRTMAVVQAAYLSARTGQPESPGNIFAMHKYKDPEQSKSGS